MSTRSFLVTIEHTGDTPDSFDMLFEQYLTEQDNPFLTDYGPEAWGGWDGPKVTSVDVIVFA